MPKKMPNRRRMYFTAEHEKRSWLLSWNRRQSYLNRTISELHDHIEMLSAELRQNREERKSYARTIAQMQQTLQDNNLTAFSSVMMSFRICVAEDNESCPLAMDRIDGCPPPFEGCCAVLDPLKPTHRCVELKCGHRFNGTWVMYHFVRNNTFRCPVCRKGKRRFVFDAAVVPECMKARAQIRTAQA